MEETNNGVSAAYPPEKNFNLRPVSEWARARGISRRHAYRLVADKKVESISFGKNHTMIVEQEEAAVP